MEFLAEVGTELVNPFRVGLIVALVLTANRTANVTGQVIPLLLGLIFVAVIIPTTMPSSQDASLFQAVTVGFIANLVILSLVKAAQVLLARFRT